MDKLQQYREMRDGFEAERNTELAIVKALREHADDHDRAVNSLTGQIGHMWSVIAKLESEHGDQEKEK